MPAKEQAKHTPGAERAARTWSSMTGYVNMEGVHGLADLISAETHDAEMLEALKALAESARLLTACIGSLDHACDLGCGRAYDALRDRTIEAEAVIRKAEGR